MGRSFRRPMKKEDPKEGEEQYGHSKLKKKKKVFTFAFFLPPFLSFFPPSFLFFSFLSFFRFLSKPANHANQRVNENVVKGKVEGGTYRASSHSPTPTLKLGKTLLACYLQTKSDCMRNRCRPNVRCIC